MKLSLLCILCAFWMSDFAHAQDQDQIKSRFTFQGGAGFSPLVGDISSRLDNGWHVTFGGGYRFTSWFSTTIDYLYNGFGVSSKVLNEAQVPDGNAHLWSVTANPMLRWKSGRGAHPYVVGGVGYYRRVVEFTQPSLVPVLYIDPFFGFAFNTLIPANEVLGSIRKGGIGGSLGAGLDFDLGSTGAKVYAEARYHYADTGNIPTRMVPVTIGLRW
jgi:opacity protein-like surface antigen